MFTKSVLFSFVIFFLLLSKISAQPQSLAYTSQKKAFEVLQQSITAYGGTAGIKKARNFSLKIRGTSYNLFQSEDPEQPFEGWALERDVVYEADKNRVYHDRKVSDVNSPYVWQLRQIFRNGKSYEIIIHENWAIKMREPSISAFTAIAQLMPQNIIADAMRATATLRYLGSENFRGEPHHVIAVRLPTGQNLNLYIDTKTHLLTKYEWFFTYSSMGDTLGEVVFADYKSLQGTMIPASRTGYYNGHTVYTNQYSEVQLDPRDVDEKLFELPAGAAMLNTVPPETKLEKIGDGVYMFNDLSGGFNVMLVEFKDFVMAVETPEDNIANGIAQETIETIKKTFPEKTIRYAVPTHHHGDHSAGMRAFMAAGATIITTRGNLKYVERLSKARFTFAPDAYSRKPLPVKAEAVANGKMVITDGVQTAEIYQFAPVTHVKEMLMVYLPKQKILYQSDMFNPIDINAKTIPEDHPYHGINKANTLDLYREIGRLGLKVEMIAGSHGKMTTYYELESAVKRIGADKR